MYKAKRHSVSCVLCLKKLRRTQWRWWCRNDLFYKNGGSYWPDSANYMILACLSHPRWCLSLVISCTYHNCLQSRSCRVKMATNGMPSVVPTRKHLDRASGVDPVKLESLNPLHCFNCIVISARRSSKYHTLSIWITVTSLFCENRTDNEKISNWNTM